MKIGKPDGEYNSEYSKPGDSYIGIESWLLDV